MIKVLIKDNFISLKGHANYDEYGKDIVCASVSSIITTSINDMMSINKDAVNYNDDKIELSISIIKDDILVKKLFENLKELLSSLEKDYPKNIKIERKD